MYNTSYFKEQDKGVVLQFIRNHPFAVMTGCEAKMPVATHLPLLLREEDGALFLQGHMMRESDHYEAFAANPEALCIFLGPQTYVSASWYRNPQSASTWNYMAVHARGKLLFTSDESLIQLLEKTTTHFENNANSPASFHQLSADYIHKLIPYIIGFEIKIESLTHVFKLSQNKDEATFHQIIHQLEKGDANAKTIAAEMKIRSHQLFSKQE